MKTKTSLIVAALAASALGRSETSFTGLGDLAGGVFESEASDLSANGQWVVGRSLGANGTTAFRWSTQTGMLSIGDLPGGTWYSFATGVSDDGGVICGYSVGANGGRGFRWTPGTGMWALTGIPGGTSPFCWASEISGDGTVIVGSADGILGDEACRWVGIGQAQGLGNLQYGSNWAQGATAVNQNGNVLGGFSGIDDDGLAFWWTQGTGMQAISNVQGYRAVHAMDMIPNGSLIVGWGSQGDGYVHAFRWSQQTGLIWYPGNSVALAISDDGRFVGGEWYPNQQNHPNPAAVYDDLHGWRLLTDVLSHYGAGGFGNWQLDTIAGLTVQGDTIVVCGNGTNPQGQSEAFVARFPVPHQFLEGQCILEDVTSMEGQQIQIDVRTLVMQNPVATYYAILDAVGRFRVETQIPHGDYTVAIKSAHHLRQTQAPIDISGYGAGLYYSLKNGDVDGDNEVGVSDYALLSSSWNLQKGDTGYIDGADLNIDDVVEISDFAILSANYGLMGDD